MTVNLPAVSSHTAAGDRCSLLHCVWLLSSAGRRQMQSCWSDAQRPGILALSLLFTHAPGFAVPNHGRISRLCFSSLGDLVGTDRVRATVASSKPNTDGDPRVTVLRINLQCIFNYLLFMEAQYARYARVGGDPWPPPSPK